jgi:hypothetical protein
MSTTTLERDMPDHFIPNTNHDLVVIECGSVCDGGVDVFEVCKYPIIGWKIETAPKDQWTEGPVPIAIGWIAPDPLHGDDWGVLDQRQGIVFNDFGLWSGPVEPWKADRERAFAARQTRQNAQEPTL